MASAMSPAAAMRRQIDNIRISACSRDPERPGCVAPHVARQGPAGSDKSKNALAD
jgi:hypothetical protein